MSNEQTKTRITQLYLSLQERDANDLLSIWEKNDREEWTDDAFEAIRQILLERMGSLPAQREKMSDEPRHVTEAITRPQRIQPRKEIIRLMWRDGFSFGLIWVVFEFISKIFPYHLLHSIAPIYTGSVLYAFAGACSAAILAYNIHPHPKVMSFAVGGALACGGGFLAGVMPGFVLIQSMPDRLPYIVMIFLPGFPLTLAFSVMGCFLGAALGIVQRDWRQVRRLTLAGAIGFSCYFLITFLYSNFVLPLVPLSLLVEKSRGIKEQPSIMVYTVHMVRGIIFGVVSGALLGFVLRQKKLDEGI
jgi:hypothetical protein